jgi:hypothetical protein
MSATILGVVMSAVTVLSLVAFGVSYYQRNATQAIFRSTPVDAKLVELSARISDTEKLVQVLQAERGAAAVTASPQFGEVIAREDAAEKRLNILETGISSDPERYLSVPLLRKDLDTESKFVDLYVAESRREHDEVQTQLLWIEGILVTICITAAATIFPMLRKRSQPHSSQSQGSRPTDAPGTTPV